jgi:hypothetical protein
MGHSSGLEVMHGAVDRMERKALAGTREEDDQLFSAEGKNRIA